MRCAWWRAEVPSTLYAQCVAWWISQCESSVGDDCASQSRTRLSVSAVGRRLPEWSSTGISAQSPGITEAAEGVEEEEGKSHRIWTLSEEDEAMTSRPKLLVFMLLALKRTGPCLLAQHSLVDAHPSRMSVPDITWHHLGLDEHLFRCKRNLSKSRGRQRRK